jgi:hypothetical protein
MSQEWELLNDSVEVVDNKKTTFLKPSSDVVLNLTEAYVDVIDSVAKIFPRDFAKAAKNTYAIEKRLRELLATKTSSSAGDDRIKEMLLMRHVNAEGDRYISVVLNTPPSHPMGGEDELYDVNLKLARIGIVNKRKLVLLWDAVFQPIIEVDEDEDEEDEEEDVEVEEAEAEESSTPLSATDQINGGDDAPHKIDQRREQIRSIVSEELEDLVSRGDTLNELIATCKKILNVASETDDEKDIDDLERVLEDFDAAKRSLLQ